MWKTRICLFLLVLGITGCSETIPYELKLTSFEVTLSSGQDELPGSAETPLQYVSGRNCTADAQCEDGESCTDGQCSIQILIDIQAMGSDGNPYPYNGWVHIDVTPGVVTPSSSYVELEDGVAKNVPVSLNRAIGKGNIWVEADGFAPAEPGQLFGQCNDGIDNDGNGVKDLGDYGCLSKDDNLEAPVSLATGASETLTFANPSIRDVQYTPNSLATSPLQTQQVRVTDGVKVVTNVVANGFYLVDIEDQSEDVMFNGIFIFTFSKPQGIYYGDVVCEFSGSVDEYVGMTQVTFPSFEVYSPENPKCNPDMFDAYEAAAAPAPTDVTESLLDEFTGIQNNHTTNCKNLEPYEANLVTFSDVAVTERLIACDQNGNGTIDAGPEVTCRSECQTDPLCTDLEGYFEYSQWAGVVAGKKKIYGSIALADRFKPLDIDYIGQPDGNGLCEYELLENGFHQYTCPPRQLESLTGALRHIHLCLGSAGDGDASCGLQFWVIDPRFNGDIAIGQDTDLDGDGVSIADGDCNDNNPSVLPGAEEQAHNQQDDDCDGETDE